MPLRNEPKTLQEASMISIARNFDYLCYRCRTPSQMKKMLEDDSYLNFDGPFQNLPSSLLTDLMTIIESCNTSFRLQRKHLHLLLLPQIEVLKLSSIGYSFGVELIKKRCKELTDPQITVISTAPNLCVGLQDALRTSFGHLRLRHLHALIHKHQEEFRMTEIGDKQYSLEIIIKRCRKLRSLDLSYLCHMSPVVMVRLIPTLQHLVILNLMKTEISDQVLSLIGNHCPDIRDLNISLCPITNYGIYSLCYNEEMKRIQCRKLLRLNVIGCLISSDALIFLLQKIPTLKELEYENILRIFNKLSELGVSINTIKELSSRVFHLHQLTASDECVSTDGVDYAVHLCPLITNITISNTLIKNEALYKIMTLQNLAHIRLTNNESLSLDFYEGVLPVLTVCGHQLVSLLLAKFTMIDISAIGECCPMLRNLAVSNIGIYEEILYPKETLFTELTALEIWTDVCSEYMSSVLLKQLLMFCPNLHNLLISGSQAFSDQLFTEILSINELKELSRITIDSCPNISRATIEAVLDIRNKVILIRVWGCFLIAKADDVFLQKKIKNENCDVYFEWFA